ncbi:hypothetical protein PHMEG_00017581 [Phytophthora megakarya]|uniref:ATP-dependent DNA helicase n=1 Tax=Phytophthora megakarya TaxID=4795 RepID=A0A225VW59_9STRA|nr:hypothetical protein PHMEG_00017581 [Phytophthora megakarya]
MVEYKCLKWVAEYLLSHGKTLDMDVVANAIATYKTDDLARTTALANQMNKNQKEGFDQVIEAVNHPVDGQKLFFVDGSGGTGKSFLLEQILAHVRLQKRVSIAVASSGIAATDEDEEKEDEKPVRVKEETVPVKVESPGDGNVSWGSSGSFGASLADLSPIALSNVVSHVVKSLPQFFSDSATVEKARLFWNAFEANTEGLPDQSRLLVFSQKLKGREAERWWGNSSIRDFKTLKLRFHNHFLNYGSACKLRNENAGSRSKNREIVNKRCLATLDSSPACDIPEATEWLMFKDMHRPIEEEDEFLGNAWTPNAVASSQAALDALSLKVDAIRNAQSQRQTHTMIITNPDRLATVLLG